MTTLYSNSWRPELKRYFEDSWLRISASMTIRGLVDHFRMATMPVWMYNHFSNCILTGFSRVTAHISSFPDHLLQFLISKKIMPNKFHWKKWWIFPGTLRRCYTQSMHLGTSFEGASVYCFGAWGYFIPTLSPAKPRPPSYCTVVVLQFPKIKCLRFFFKEQITIPPQRYHKIRFGRLSSCLVTMQVVIIRGAFVRCHMCPKRSSHNNISSSSSYSNTSSNG